MRALLLQAAARRIDVGGRQSISVRRLAQDLEAHGRQVTHTAMLFHFKSLDALLLEVAASWWTDCANAVEAQSTGGLEEMLLAYVNYAIEYPNRFRLMYDAALWRRQVSCADCNADTASISPSRDRLFALVVESVLRSQRDRAIAKAASGQDAARLLSSLAHGLAMEFIDEHLSELRESPVESNRDRKRQHARTLLRMALNGLREMRPDVD